MCGYVCVYASRCLKLNTCEIAQELDIFAFRTGEYINLYHYGSELRIAYVLCGCQVWHVIMCDRTHRMWYVATVRTSIYGDGLVPVSVKFLDGIEP